MPSSAWAGWIYILKVQWRWKLQRVCRTAGLRAAQLWYEVYSSCGGGGLRCNVLHRRRPLNFQLPVRAAPLVFLTSLWFTMNTVQSTAVGGQGLPVKFWYSSLKIDRIQQAQNTMTTSLCWSHYTSSLHSALIFFRGQNHGSKTWNYFLHSPTYHKDILLSDDGLLYLQLRWTPIYSSCFSDFLGGVDIVLQLKSFTEMHFMGFSYHLAQLYGFAFIW
jgi:hypothetical protein